MVMHLSVLYILSHTHTHAHTRLRLAGPEDLYTSPVTTQQEYGWWSRQDDCMPQPWTHTEKHPLVNSEMTRCVCIYMLGKLPDSRSACLVQQPLLLTASSMTSAIPPQLRVNCCYSDLHIKG